MSLHVSTIHRASLPTLFPAMDRTTPVSPVYNADAHAGSDPRPPKHDLTSFTGWVTAL